MLTNAEALQPGDKLAPPNDEKSESYDLTL